MGKSNVTPSGLGMWRDLDLHRMAAGRYVVQGHRFGVFGDEDAAAAEAGATAEFLKNWGLTLVGSALTAVQDGSPPTSTFTSEAADASGINAQWGHPHTIAATAGFVVSEVFKLDALDKPLWFEWRGKFDSLRQVAFLGLSLTDTAIAAGASTDLIGFRVADNDADINFAFSKNFTDDDWVHDGTALNSIDSLVDYAANTILTIGFYIPTPGAGDVEIWKDGELIQELPWASYVTWPDDEEMALTISFLEGNDNAVVHTMQRCVCIQDMGE